ncbi:hypothetical protein ABI59_15150 [Acidobacteria bacterium Mor1]|nr:hypothetical protein ABI59_15150 [Acidobacteria bacterium Mor1]
MLTLRRLALLVSAFAMAVLTIQAGTATATLSFNERVEAWRAIEQVYWDARLWPETNPGPKPPLSEVLPDSALRERVRDSLRKSNALEALWNRPITHAQLQAELDRMVRSTRDPELLRQLFQALGNDPFLIAETLGRGALADRRLRAYYESDGKLHADLRKRVREANEGEPSLSRWVESGAVRKDERRRFKPAPMGDQSATGEYRNADPPATATADPGEWQAWLTQLREATDALLTLDTWGPLHEDRSGFHRTRIVTLRDDLYEIERVHWPKPRFETWWRDQAQRMPITLQAAAGEYTLGQPSQENTCTDDTWRRLSPAPTPRHDATAIWTGSEMIVYGGRDLTDLVEFGGRYDPATDTWYPMTGVNAPGPRANHSAVWTGTEMIVFGGTGSGEFGGPTRYTGGRYNPATDTWVPTSTEFDNSGYRRREGHSAVWTGTEMLVWAGGTLEEIAHGEFNFLYHRDGWRYDPASDTWAEIPDTTVINGRAGHTAIWTGSEMIVWGGHLAESNPPEGGIFDPVSGSWTAMPVGPAGRYHHAAVWTGDRMIVWGGWDGSATFGDGGIFDPAANSWSFPTTVNAPGFRRQHSAVWTGNEMIVWAGIEATLGYVSDGSRYDPVSDSWTAIASLGAPSRRTQHTAVWTGDEMVVWGGYSGEAQEEVANGGRYDPALDLWLPMEAGLPLSRTRQTAVWTGAEMIAWGGRDDPDLWRLDLATGSWSQGNVTGAPDGLYDAAAVWTGTEMLSWGGRTLTHGSTTSLGGRYDPTLDQWTPMSDTGVPDERYDHTAVWTGNELIVWGGREAPADSLNTGGRYDPAADSWQPTATLDAPSPRNTHSMVWTGTEMIVWGGLSQAPGDGGRYDPIQDTWTPMVDADHPRGGHAAVWTGSEMIVWGGYDSSGEINTGRRFNPATGVWTDTSSCNMLKTEGHVAVWTGSEMLVMRGPVFSGRYDPVTDNWMRLPYLGHPEKRTDTTAVWTGSEMLIYGGSTGSEASRHGGAYCPGARTGDEDTDGVRDEADNCPLAANPCQENLDNDDRGDLCDCAIDDAFTWGEPGPAQNLTLDGVNPTTLRWDPPAVTGGATRYDLLRSRDAGSFAMPRCVIEQRFETSANDSLLPLPGECLYYFVRATTGCGENLGVDSLGQPRTAGACFFDDYPAVGETAVEGSVFGTYEQTTASDNLFQVIREVGSPASLEHIWHFSIPTGSDVELHVEASTQGLFVDKYSWYYSDDDGSNWHLIDSYRFPQVDGPVEVDVIPGIISGDILIRLVDEDVADPRPDDVRIDHLFLRIP